SFLLNTPPTTEIYTLSLHDALPIWLPGGSSANAGRLVIDPTDDNIVYAATTAGVYRTANGGTSWTARTSGWPTIHGNLFGASGIDRKSTRLNSSHLVISYAVFCLKK